MSSHSQDGKTSSCKNCIDENYDFKQKRRHHPDGESVYFIQDSRNKHVKISSGINHHFDLDNLQEGSSETLHVLASFKTNHYEYKHNRRSPNPFMGLF